MLVAESCAALAPYTSPGLSGSLIISMLKQMLTEDKNPEVREKVTHSLAIVCLYVDDPDKLYQLVDLLRIGMADAAEPVVRATVDVYLPALAVWVQCHSVLGVRLIEGNFLSRLESANEAAIAIGMMGLMRLIPLMYADVVRGGPWKDSEHDVDVVVDDGVVESVRNRYGLFHSRVPPCPQVWFWCWYWCWFWCWCWLILFLLEERFHFSGTRDQKSLEFIVKFTFWIAM